MQKAQRSLYIWLSNFDRKSYDSIRQNCDYLNQVFELGLDTYSIWTIFYPLVYSGVIDYAGRGFYALTEPVAVDLGDHYVYTNRDKQPEKNTTPFIGLYSTSEESDIKNIPISRFDALSVLKTLPSVESVVDSFPKSIADLEGAEYYNWKSKKGVTKRLKDGFLRYFSIPELNYQREIPDKSINPDAFNISYCYGRVVNKEFNGSFNRNTCSLSMEAFGLPIMVYRVLMLESMKSSQFPERNNNIYTFPCISARIAKELNRIFCNSIRYE